MKYRCKFEKLRKLTWFIVGFKANTDVKNDIIIVCAKSRRQTQQGPLQIAAGINIYVMRSLNNDRYSNNNTNNNTRSNNDNNDNTTWVVDSICFTRPRALCWYSLIATFGHPFDIGSWNCISISVLLNNNKKHAFPGQTE